MPDLVSLLTGRIRSKANDLAAAAVVYGIAGILAVTAYVALLYAAGLAISREAGPMVAALSIAAGTIVLALAAVAVLRIRQRRRRRLLHLRTRSAVASGTGAAAAAMIPMMVRASPVGSLLAVAVLAYVVSRAGQREAGRSHRQ